MCAKLVKAARMAAVLAALAGSLVLAACSVSVDTYPHHHYYRGHYYDYD
jgi:outer membrane protein assembly factor BamE (lipoprotein component of BamABCDE complex)